MKASLVRCGSVATLKRRGSTLLEKSLDVSIIPRYAICFGGGLKTRYLVSLDTNLMLH